MVKIKICGIRDVATAHYCARLGIDYIGLVLTRSPRRINPETAREITGSLAVFPRRPRIVGVFAGQDYRKVNELVRFCALDIVQLSADENSDYIRRIDAPCFKSVHITPSITETELLNRVETLLQSDHPGLKVLLDSHPDHRYGGSGQIFEWAVAGETCARFPVMIAGGLSGQNVVGMLEKLHPWGVDVSSGVEKDGAKCPGLISNFVSAVKGSLKTSGGNND